MCGSGVALCRQDFTKDERKQLAIKSRTEVPKFGSPARQKVINDMHQRMLELQQQAAAASSSSNSKESATADAAAPVAPATPAAVPLVRTVSSDTCADAAYSSDQDSSKQHQQRKLAQQQHKQPTCTQPSLKQDQQQQQQVIAGSSTLDSHKAVQDAAKQASSAPAAVPQAAVANQQHLQLQHAAVLAAGSRPSDMGDKGLAFLAVVLSVAIAAMLLKKVMTAMGGYGLFVEM
eukprot:GHUV01015242.1.p1 GENE.GHUV01015242.1~~GHUV01015242.1.p1  ORF type:complete len:233 (+),score=129.87 GHUV01015242.1:172-870(+)